MLSDRNKMATNYRHMSIASAVAIWVLALTGAVAAIGWTVAFPNQAFADERVPVAYAYSEWQRTGEGPAGDEQSAAAVFIEAQPRPESGDGYWALGPVYDGEPIPWRSEDVFKVKVCEGVSPKSIATWFDSIPTYNKIDVDLSEMDTTNLESASGAFTDCSSIASVALPAQTPSKAVDCSSMFEGCDLLSSVEFGGFGNASLSNAESMFKGCARLKEIDLSNANTEDAASMTGMFQGCSNLAKISVGAHFAFAGKGSGVFKGVGGPWSTEDASGTYETLDDIPQGVAAVYVRKASEGINAYLLPSTGEGDDSVLSIRTGYREPAEGEVYLGAVGEDFVPWSRQHSGRKYNVVKFENEVAPTSTRSWFEDPGMGGVEDSIRFENLGLFDTSRVTDMSYMFSNCDLPADFDFSALNTSNVESMERMFYFSDIKDLDISRLDTSHVKNLSWFLGGSLPKGFDKLDVSSATDISGLFQGERAYAGIDLSSFDTSKAAVMDDLFSGASLKDVDLSKLDTSSAVSMKYMFSNASLQGADLGKLKAPHVTDMSEMFYSADLSGIDLTGFDTSNVADMSKMFYSSNLSGACVGGLNTSSATDMSEMFALAKGLESFGFESWDVSHVNNADRMFCGCGDLASVSFEGASFTKHCCFRSMFAICEKLAQVNFGDMQREDWLGGVERMFYECGTLSTIRVGAGFDAPGVVPRGTWKSASTGKLYRNDTLPTGIADTYSFEDARTYSFASLSKETGELRITSEEPESGGGLSVYSVSEQGYETADEAPWADKRASITTVVVESTGKVSSMANWFNGCENLTSVDLAGIDSTNLTSIEGFCEGCRSLRSVVVGPDYASNKLGTAARAFKGCKSLSEVPTQVLASESGISGYCYLSDISETFASCTSLESVDFSACGISNVRKMAGLFDKCSNLKRVVFPEGCQAYSASDMSRMFRMCASLTDIENLSYFNSSGSVTCDEMFRGCSSLEQLDLSSLNTGQRSMKRMFHGCTSLNKISVGTDFCFTSYRRKGGSEFPDGIWAREGATDIAYMSNSIPSWTAATYVRVSDPTEFNVVSLYGEGTSSEVTQTSQVTVDENGVATLEVDYDFSNYTASNEVNLNDDYQAAKSKTLNRRRISKQKVRKVAANWRITEINIGSKVTSIDAYAFSEAPSVWRLNVKSPALKTPDSVYGCLWGSNISSVMVKFSKKAAKKARSSKAKVVNAFNWYSGYSVAWAA